MNTEYSDAWTEDEEDASVTGRQKRTADQAKMFPVQQTGQTGASTRGQQTGASVRRQPPTSAPPVSSDTRRDDTEEERATRGKKPAFTYEAMRGAPIDLEKFNVDKLVDLVEKLADAPNLYLEDVSSSLEKINEGTAEIRNIANQIAVNLQALANLQQTNNTQEVTRRLDNIEGLLRQHANVGAVPVAGAVPAPGPNPNGQQPSQDYRDVLQQIVLGQKQEADDILQLGANVEFLIQGIQQTIEKQQEFFNQVTVSMNQVAENMKQSFDEVKKIAQEQKQMSDAERQNLVQEASAATVVNAGNEILQATRQVIAEEFNKKFPDGGGATGGVAAGHGPSVRGPVVPPPPPPDVPPPTVNQPVILSEDVRDAILRTDASVSQSTYNIIRHIFNSVEQNGKTPEVLNYLSTQIDEFIRGAGNLSTKDALEIIFAQLYFIRNTQGVEIASMVVNGMTQQTLQQHEVFTNQIAALIDQRFQDANIMIQNTINPPINADNFNGQAADNFQDLPLIGNVGKQNLFTLMEKTGRIRAFLLKNGIPQQSLDAYDGYMNVARVTSNPQTIGITVAAMLFIERKWMDILVDSFERRNGTYDYSEVFYKSLCSNAASAFQATQPPVAGGGGGGGGAGNANPIAYNATDFNMTIEKIALIRAGQVENYVGIDYHPRVITENDLDPQIKQIFDENGMSIPVIDNVMRGNSQAALSIVNEMKKLINLYYQRSNSMAESLGETKRQNRILASMAQNKTDKFMNVIQQDLKLTRDNIALTVTSALAEITRGGTGGGGGGGGGGFDFSSPPRLPRFNSSSSSASVGGGILSVGAPRRPHHTTIESVVTKRNRASLSGLRISRHIPDTLTCDDRNYLEKILNAKATDEIGIWLCPYDYEEMMANRSVIKTSLTVFFDDPVDGVYMVLRGGKTRSLHQTHPAHNLDTI